ncbi:hypothetical protein Glove_372g107 [Diversispora epigaea]|uniref:Protein kinase domain-containing protein n=1 Tax=Diversispora epigaea TaxID=1348612 RepID=A0A397HAS1_9GLOM|nr:hypothetical protein Glove_372g107 [Diversispora epigaea]
MPRKGTLFFCFCYCCFYISLSSFSSSHHSHHFYHLCNSIIPIICTTPSFPSFAQLHHSHHLYNSIIPIICTTPSFPSFPRHTFSALFPSYHASNPPSSPQYHKQGKQKCHLVKYVQNAIKNTMDLNGAIPYSQLNANGHWEVIEWIPYDRFKDVKQIGRGGFGTIHFARWIDGFIEKWDIKNHQWERYDFGLSKIIKENPNNPEKKNIVGVLPYIAPEVLSGEKEYTKAADVYSFGIIAYEIVIGFPPYPDIPHDKDLAMKICNGLRPKILFHIPKLITRMIMSKSRINQYDNYNNHNTYPQAIYTSRLLNYSNLPKPKNEENFEKELEELTKSTSALSIVASKLHVPNF